MSSRLGDAALDRLLDAVRFSEPSELVPGARVGPYEVIATLAQGGMATVYRAQPTTGGPAVALKVVSEAATPHLVERFVREARLAQSLCHPDIVPVLGSGEDDGLHWIAMALVEGPTLADALPGLSRDTAVALVARIARAVHAAHQQGVLHRDLKPSNVLLDDGEPRIVDFGLARRIETTLHPITRTGARLGTPTHMAPEQLDLRYGRPGARTDVYALGVMLYQALTGRPPFVAESVAELFDQVLHAAPVPPGDVRPDVPRALERACLAALSKQAHDRPPTAAALASAIEGAQRPSRTPPRRSATGRWVVAACLLIALAVLAATWPEPTPPPRPVAGRPAPRPHPRSEPTAPRGNPRDAVTDALEALEQAVAAAQLAACTRLVDSFAGHDDASLASSPGTAVPTWSILSREGAGGRARAALLRAVDAWAGAGAREPLAVALHAWGNADPAAASAALTAADADAATRCARRLIALDAGDHATAIATATRTRDAARGRARLDLAIRQIAAGTDAAQPLDAAAEDFLDAPGRWRPVTLLIRARHATPRSVDPSGTYQQAISGLDANDPLVPIVRINLAIARKARGLPFELPEFPPTRGRPLSWRERRDRASRAIVQGRPTEVLDVLVGNEPQIRQLRAQVLVRIKRYVEALPDLDALVARDPTDDVALFLRGWAQIGGQRVAAGIADLDRLLSRNPRPARAWLLRAEAHRSRASVTNQDAVRAALRDFAEATRRDPSLQARVADRVRQLRLLRRD